MSEVLSIGAWELADLIKRRRLSPVEVVHAHIARIEEVNPRLNAVVVERFDAACDEARSAEEALASGTRPGPLHGVPFTVKEIISVKGMPLTCGSILRRHRRSSFAWASVFTGCPAAHRGTARRRGGVCAMISNGLSETAS